jgi:hypothetical protein
MSFQRVVVTIAIVILILSLIVLGIVIFNARNKDQYPPEMGNCPDYFVMKQKNSNSDAGGVNTEMCYNKHNLGNKSQGCEWFDPKDATNKERGAFAKQCGVTWDGVTNF